jgi:hypothetical protein
MLSGAAKFVPNYPPERALERLLLLADEMASALLWMFGSFLLLPHQLPDETNPRYRYLGVS